VHNTFIVHSVQVNASEITVGPPATVYITEVKGFHNMRTKNRILNSWTVHCKSWPQKARNIILSSGIQHLPILWPV